MDDFFENIMSFFWPTHTPENYVMPVKPVETSSPLDEVKIEAELQERGEAAPEPPLFTLEQLRKVMPRLPEQKAVDYYPELYLATQEFEINSLSRVAAFLAQIAHESAELHYFEELGRPAYFHRYDDRIDLGNSKPGDGYKFRGRGPIQLTGRLNYRKAGRALKLDLENDPDIVSSKDVAFRVAGLFWKGHGLNQLADVQDFKQITRRINGGYIGLAERTRYYKVALSVLA